jgi:hypothetical protein
LSDSKIILDKTKDEGIKLHLENVKIKYGRWPGKGAGLLKVYFKDNTIVNAEVIGIDLIKKPIPIKLPIELREE